MRATVWLTACSVGLLAIATAFAAPQNDPYKDIRTIGVISVLGSTIEYRSPAVLFGPNKEPLQLELQFDNLITERIVGMLSGRFSAKGVAVEAATFGDAVAIGRTNIFRDRVLVLGSDGIDAYLIVHPQSPGTMAPGLGFSGGLGPPNLSAIYQVTVVDAKAGQALDFGTGFLRGGGPFGNVRAMLVCERSMRADKVAQLTNDRKKPSAMSS